MSHSLHNSVDNGLLALATLGAEPVRVTADTPRISIFLHKRRIAIEWIAALRAEKVTSVPLCSTRHDHLAFDRCLTALAPWAEKLVEVKMAVEARAWVAVLVFQVESLF